MGVDKQTAEQWIVKRKTASDRLTRALQAVSAWCKRHRHAPLREQQAGLRRKLLGHYGHYGHYGCYGITGNARSLGRFRWEVQHFWKKWLNRRGGKRHHWESFVRLLERYPLPAVRVVHSIYTAKSAT